MIESRLDDCVALGFQIVPSYSTRIVPLDNGREQRNANWTKAKRRFTAVYQNFTPDEFAILLACFHAARGSAYNFRFKDWSDYTAQDEVLSTVPGANTTPVQLTKKYTFGGFTTYRDIVKPNAEGFTMYENGVAKAGVLDTTTGRFTPSANWTAGATLSWTGTFDVPVRFASDEFPSTYENLRAITTTAELVEDFL
jgi:uncharacterized protein (TIGR02217 family)